MCAKAVQKHECQVPHPHRQGQRRERDGTESRKAGLNKFGEMQQMMKKMGKFSKMMGKMGGGLQGMLRR